MKQQTLYISTLLRALHARKIMIGCVEEMVALSVIYTVGTAASLFLAVFASLLITYATGIGWFGKIFLIPLVAYLVSCILSLVLQALTCDTVMFGSTIQGNLLFPGLIPMMWLLCTSDTQQTLPYLQRIVTSVLDSSWTNEQKSPFAYAYWTFFTSLLLFAFLFPVQTACVKK
jgi:hypothetical protein